MGIEIKKATAADIDEIERMYDALNDHLAAGTNWPGWKKGVYPVRQNALDGLVEDALYVARLQPGGPIAGSVVLNHLPETPPVHGRWLIEATDDEVLAVHVFVVHPTYMRRGVGTALLAFAERLASDRRMKSLRLDVYEKNLPAIHTYERCGYQYIDTVDIGLGHYGLDWFRLYEKLVPPRP